MYPFQSYSGQPGGTDQRARHHCDDASSDHEQDRGTPTAELPSCPIRLQARPKPAAIPLVLQERLKRTWYNVDSGPWRASDLPRIEIVRLDLQYRLLDLPRTWFEFRDVEKRRILLDRQVRPWKSGTALEFARDPQSSPSVVGAGLFFYGLSEIKCLRDYPPDWADMSDEQLVGLLEWAGPAQ